jgi:hypothetical protein
LDKFTPSDATRYGKGDVKRAFIPGQILPSEEVKDKRNNHTDDNRGRQRKVKAKIAPIDVDVPRQAAEPRELRAEREQQPERGEQETEKDQGFPQGIHERKTKAVDYFVNR